MSERPRENAPAQIRKERESFVVLQHLYTLTGAGDPEMPCAKLAADLGLGGRGCGELVDHLIRAGYVARVRLGRGVRITPEGVAYIERLARRRRSVRLPQKSAGAAGL